MFHFFCKFYIAGPNQNWQGLGPALSMPGAAIGDKYQELHRDGNAGNHP